MKFLFALVFAVVAGHVASEKLRFDNHALYRIIPKSKEIVDILSNLEHSPATGYNFFSGVRGKNHPVDILVSPSYFEEFKALLARDDVESKILTSNIQEKIDHEGFRPEARANSFDWTSYHTLDEINKWLHDLAFNYPDKVTLLNGGRTYQNRDILGVKISYNASNADNIVFIEANIHAREWITSAVATYLIDQLLISQDKDVRGLANQYDWYIFPVTNPDGFVYTHNNNRMWRKTRTPYSLLCYGADPNRNWPFEWMQGGASDRPCADTYAGPNPLSENSTNSLANFISSIGTRLTAYISFHSYSQMLLLPYGHTTQHLDNYDELMDIGRKAISDLSRRYGTQYVVGNIAETIYVATGGSMDWVKHTFEPILSYTYELRDQGKDGFILPANQIIPTALETIDSLVSIFRSYSERHPR